MINYLYIFYRIIFGNYLFFELLLIYCLNLNDKLSVKEVLCITKILLLKLLFKH